MVSSRTNNGDEWTDEPKNLTSLVPTNETANEPTQVTALEPTNESAVESADVSYEFIFFSRMIGRREGCDEY